MDISINLKFNNMNFYSRYTKVSKEKMDNILFPLLDEKNLDIETLVKKSGFSHLAILNWFKNSVGQSAAKYFKDKKLNILKKQIEDLHNQGLNYNEVAKLYGYSSKWAYNKYIDFGLKLRREDINERINQELPKMIKEGYTTRNIAKKLNCSVTIIYNWMHENLKVGISEYRQINNIKIKHELNNIEKKEAELLKKYFSEGKNAKEVSELMNMSPSKISILKHKYNIKSMKEEAHDRLSELVPALMNDKISLKEMSKIIGTSITTISRWIKTVHGKSYSDICKNR